MHIAIIGTGYVGLVTGTCFAELGVDVTCVDIDTDKIVRLKEGIIPIYEPGLEAMVVSNHQAGRLQFTTELAEAVRGAAAVFIAVGTPEDAKGRADLTYVFTVAEALAETLENGAVVVTKSTVPVGTNAQIKAAIMQANPALECYVASNPEFLREGSAIHDFLHPDRVVIGTEHPKAAQIMQALYAPLAAKDVPILSTDIASAEMIKYASNAFLATKIGFINEIADLCTFTQANVEDVAQGMGLDSRIGPKNLKPGPGFGGSCFPKDTLALTKIARDHHVPVTVVEAVIESNVRRKTRMADTIIEACGGDVSGKKLAILGLAFKANTDDMRHAPSLDIIPILQQAGAQLHLHDPAAIAQAKPLLPLPNLIWCESLEAALCEAEAVVILTEWQAYTQLDLATLTHNGLRVLVDLRNIYAPEDMQALGLQYVSVGR